MQIILKDIKYNKLNNINLNINDNKITGIIGSIGSGKTDLTMLIGNKIVPGVGTIEYDSNQTDEKIGIISNFSYEEMLDGNVDIFIRKKSIEYNYKLETIDKRVEEILKMVGLQASILNKNVFNLSKSEKIKVLLSSLLLYNPELIILDGIIEELDSRSRTKLFKLIIKLKKFYNKTIIITSCNVDNIYEFIDDLIILENGKIVASGNKFDIYNNEEISNNELVPKPLTVEFKNKIKRKLNINLGNNDCINELIKAIYREIR